MYFGIIRGYGVRASSSATLEVLHLGFTNLVVLA